MDSDTITCGCRSNLAALFILPFHTQRHLMQRFILLSLLALFPVFTLGCGSRATDGGTFVGAEIKGTVTLNGQPVDAGIVTVMNDKGDSCTAQIADGGTFTLNNAPLGKVYIGVNTKAVKGQAMMNNANMKGKSRERIVDVPARYMEPKQSGLVEDIQSGMTLEIKLKK
jgi:hypothetical protein